MLLNIDKPRRTATLHVDTCPLLRTGPGTWLKPLGKLGRDGGWFVIESEEAAQCLTKRELPQGRLLRCRCC